jgi:hypothetical protein
VKECVRANKYVLYAVRRLPASPHEMKPHLFLCDFFLERGGEGVVIGLILYVQGPAFNVTHFESRITYILYTARNTTHHD